ncbi:CvpA family protein [Bacillus smithii]|uniref:CvpA family protein n=1 Tax=Bacillus smithii TaxID=1479 RepID=UPI002E23A934|nr:CvpA family protein [Bacillus smithii]
MLDLLLALFLISGIVIGLKRGLISQLFHMTSSILALIAAYAAHDAVAARLSGLFPAPSLDGNGSSGLLFFAHAVNVDKLFYGAIVFVIIFVAVKIALSFLASMLSIVANLPVIRQFNMIGGGILGFLEIYVVLLVLIVLGTFLPVDSIQAQLQQSVIAGAMINHTPIVSDYVKQLIAFNPTTL